MANSPNLCWRSVDISRFLGEYPPTNEAPAEQRESLPPKTMDVNHVMIDQEVIVIETTTDVEKNTRSPQTSLNSNHNSNQDDRDLMVDEISDIMKRAKVAATVEKWDMNTDDVGEAAIEGDGPVERSDLESQQQQQDFSPEEAIHVSHKKSNFLCNTPFVEIYYCFLLRFSSVYPTKYSLEIRMARRYQPRMTQKVRSSWIGREMRTGQYLERIVQ